MLMGLNDFSNDMFTDIQQSPSTFNALDSLLGCQQVYDDNISSVQSYGRQELFNPKLDLRYPATSSEFTSRTPVSATHHQPIPQPNYSRANVVSAKVEPEPVYSSSGFDIVQALVKMMTRANPKVQLGPVDLSCSFIVMDIKGPDMPIVYASPSFEKLTGYTCAEIIGRNCRFLQAPKGQVFPGQNRLFTDHSVVQRMKQCVEERCEGQFTLVNYKKGGEVIFDLSSHF
jgi:PAS domain S-box-containing protein